jgi:glycosyltransferase involved in cell wall biosynthesis
LRIGLFTECYRPIQNGIVASVDSLASAIRARGHEAVCFTPSMPGYHEVEEFVVRIPSLPLPTRTAYRLTLPLLSSERVTRALEHLSIVHTHSAFVTGWMGARFARRVHIPHVFTYHTQLEEYAHYFPLESRLTRSAAAGLTRSHCNSAALVIVPTGAMERHLRDLGVRSRIEVVPSGIDVATFGGGRRREDLRRRLGVGPRGTMIVAVGRLGREKNLELAIEAFARLDRPEAHLVLIGDGPHRDALERAAQRAGVAARTTFGGEYSRDALPDVYASADALAFTSRSETQGLVLAEALAAGLPVVALDTPQTRDVLGGAGTIVTGEPEAFAAALRATLAGPRRAVSAATVSRFDACEIGSRILALYSSLTEPLSVAAAG